jgi:alpha-tubulin suppressor-like RCC1 family protein
VNQGQLLDLCYRAMRDEGLTADEVMERFGAQEIADQVKALEQPLAFRPSVPAARGAGSRKADMLQRLRARRPTTGPLSWLTARPLRGALAAGLGLALVGTATVGAANPGGVRDSVTDALGITSPEGECAGSLSGGQVELCGWGANYFAQLGPASTSESETMPVGIAVEEVVSVAAGDGHVLALLEDGRVLAWGSDNLGELGDGGELVDDPLAEPAVSSAPVEVDLGLVPDGVVVTAIAAGGEHSLALLSDGTVIAWGADESGQLGNDEALESQPAPVRVAELEGVQAIAASSGHSLALLEDGSVRAWGGNFWGQLGNGGDTDEPTPVRVEGIDDAVAIAAGVFHSLALLGDGTVRSWGGNTSGQLGIGTIAAQEPGEELGPGESARSPVEVPGLANVQQIAAGQEHSLALLEDGTVRAWGWDELGQLGDSEDLVDQPAPVPVEGLFDVSSIAAGYRHSLAVLRDGSVRSWGQNDFGELGNGNRELRATPVRVEGLREVDSLAAGQSFSLALRMRSTAEGDEFIAITKGDWVEIVAEDCVQVVQLPPSTSLDENRISGCAEPGTVLMVVGGPDVLAGERFWALSGFGWVSEQALRFHHEGAPPYPQREELVEQGLIAFVGNDRGLWLMGADGSERRRINRGPVIGEPQWSPDGRLILFAGEGRLRVVNTSGAMLLELPGFHPWEELAWSPDSTMFTARLAPDGDVEVASVSVMGTDGTLVADFPDAAEPSWSADSRRLAFFLTREASDFEFNAPARGAYVELASGQVTPLEDDLSHEAYSEGPPLWHPTDPNVLTYRGRLIDVFSGQESQLIAPVSAFSPDGRYVILDEQGETGGTALDYQIYDLEEDERVLRFRIPICGCDAPDWTFFRGGDEFSRDSRYFLLRVAAEDDPEDASVSVFDITSTDRFPLPSPGTATGYSPDATLLLWSGRTTVFPELSGVSEWIWVTDIDGGSVTMLAEGEFPAWQPVELDASPPGLPEEAVEKAVTELGQEFAGDCASARAAFASGTCYVERGISGSEVVFGLEDAESSAAGPLLFVREEGEGFVVGHLEPPPCQGQTPCPPPAGAIVEIVVKETCANARLEPGIEGPINRCALLGTSGMVVGEPVELDGRTWIEVEGLGWVSVSFVRCTEDCG